MIWTDKCILELTHHNLFENDEHRQRFRDLLSCYCSAPFFNRGLCKCMYLAAWDDEHFAQLLDVLNEMTIARDKNLQIMEDQGIVMEEEARETEKNFADACLYELSNDFLSGEPFDMSLLDQLAVSDPEAAYIVRKALMASACIDELPPQ